MDKHKKINLINFFILAFATLFMIIGLGLLSSNAMEIKDKGVTVLTANGFGLISGLESGKNTKVLNHTTNQLENSGNGMLDIFKKKINLSGHEVETSSFVKNIGKIRCGVVFTVFLTPILLSISITGFGYNYFNLYKFYKSKK